MHALLGLRGRLVAALVVTGIVTLVAAATALVSPLDRQLRRDALDSLTTAAKASRASFEQALDEGGDRASLSRLARGLRRRTGAEIVVLGGRDQVLASTDLDPGERYPEARRALATDKVVRDIGSSPNEEQQTRVAMPANGDAGRVAVFLRKSLEDATAASAVVRRALLTAALVGLGTALLLGIVLATQLGRRLASLRTTALRVAELGPVVEMRPTSARDEVGDLTRAFATMQDRLREQEEARRTFVSTASHELRTPLASLRLMLELLQEDLADEHPDLDDARTQVERANSQAGRLAALAGDLLELSRIDSGIPARRELVELGELARSVIAEFEPAARDRDLEVVLLAPEPRWAVGDPGGVARIVRTLLDNALRFAPAGSAVSVSVPPEATSAEIRVADEGPGIPAEESEIVFDRFTRGSRTADEAGFGLGLAIGRELARRTGGDLRLEPGGPGARFTLTLEPAPAP